MKKLLSLVLLTTLTASLLTGCGSKEQDGSVIRVGASSTPHAEILNAAKDAMKEKGYTLEIKEFTDYVLPNTAVEHGELDANYFQHLPYLENFNKENGTKLVSVAAIHYEPFGIYPGKISSLSDLKDGDKVAVPNDTSNEARALLLLEEQGLLTLKEDAGVNATVKDIVKNPKNLKFVELEAAQIARSLPDVSVGIINGNFALQAGLSVEEDAITAESADSLATKTYENILVVKEGNEENEGIKALIEVLQSDEIKEFITNTYKGCVQVAKQ